MDARAAGTADDGIQQRTRVRRAEQPSEQTHEWSLSDSAYRALQDGSLGYLEILSFQTTSLFSGRPISFVNPPIRVFVRRERLASLADRRARLEIGP